MSSSLSSVSDEWPSSPRSASPRSLPSAPNLGSVNASVRSLKPRPNSHRRTSSAAHQSKTKRLPPVQEHDDRKVTRVLSEQNPSELNRNSAGSTSRTVSSQPKDEKFGTRGRRISRTVSSASFQSTRYQTVQQKSQSSSPPKQRQGLRTPEWRKRLLHGEMGYGEMKDLFSPTGLENVFRPPPPRQRMNPSFPLSAGGDELPSSPPPYKMAGAISKDRPNKSATASVLASEANKENNRAQAASVPDTTEAISNTRAPGGVIHILEHTRTTPPDEDMTPPTTAYRVELEAARNGSQQRERADQSCVSCLSVQSNEAENEEISPIFLSKHNTVDGRVGFAALDSPGKQLQQELSQIRSGDSEPDRGDHSHIMSTDTIDYASRGGFINVHRGGFSEEGSFRRRNLSPSSLPIPDSSMLDRGGSFDEGTPQRLPEIRQPTSSPEDHSNVLPADSSPKSPPKTPEQSPPREDSAGVKSRVSGSPLKLFGTYDTFTNNKLLRRMSQFQDTMDVESEEDEDKQLPEHKVNFPTNTEHDRFGKQSMVSDRAQSEALSRQRPPSERHSTSSVVDGGRFGDGQLDQFKFEEEYSIGSPNSDDNDEDQENQPPLPDLNPYTQTKFMFDVETTHQQEDFNTSHRRFSRHFAQVGPLGLRETSSEETVSRNGKCSNRDSQQDVESWEEKAESDLEQLGAILEDRKRLPHSPYRIRTPKRRRTLRDGDLHSSPVHQRLQSILGRKRKDARYDKADQAADPEVLATRRILRPRNPTPSQRSSNDCSPETGVNDRYQAREASLAAKSTQEDMFSQPQYAAPSTQAVTKALAALAISEQPQSGTRKPSVTTQDFYDEANKIMELIRAKGIPRSGMTSVEESPRESFEKSAVHSSDPAIPGSNGNGDQSTLDSFSRPPSREGRPLRAPHAFQQTDPKILSHLEKFSENNDKNGIITSSIRMPSFSPRKADPPKGVTTETLTSQTSYQSPNIRIFQNQSLHHDRPLGSAVLSGPTNETRSDVNSQRSNLSSRVSSERTTHSGSSDTRKLIVMDQVSHLIPEEVAGMTYDSTKQAWVKSKSSSEMKKDGHTAKSDGSDEDPFQNISDLSVNETEELGRSREPSSTRGTGQSSTPNGDSAKGEGRRLSEHVQTEYRPQTREGPISQPENWSSTPSKISHFASSEQKIETRATSWGDSFKAPMSKPTVYDLSKAANMVAPLGQQSANYEIQRPDDGMGPVPRFTPLPQDRRSLTITFSSPLVSQVNQHATQPYRCSAGEIWTDADEADLEDSGIDQYLELEQSLVSQTSLVQRPSSGSIHGLSWHNPSRRVSLNRKSFNGRPVSRIEEHDEEDGSPITPGAKNGARRSSEMVLATPLPLRDLLGSASMPPPTSARRSEVSFHLSPLPDFTVHEPDESFALELSHIVKRRGELSLKSAQASLEIAMADLVKRLTDIEPYEPYWDFIQRMDISSKGLVTLWKLDEFCPRLEELDASDNELGQVSGAPQTVRHLNLARNCLSNLTAWGHLTNLQFLDVSGNDIETLEGFSNLIHLRELKADDNRISSVDGVFEVEGLMSLRMRRNRLTHVDFRDANWRYMTRLDLQGNQLVEVSNLHQIPKLVELNLDNNEMIEFHSEMSEPLKEIQIVRLQGNHLHFVDASAFVGARALYLDRNHLRGVQGLEKCRRLDTLSIREQSYHEVAEDSAEGTGIPPFDSFYESRKLFLSGTFIPSTYQFKPSVSFLNLQSLQLASSGLSSLPPRFGRLLPNVRVLNLNFNALSSLRPIVGMSRLKKLYAAGNRLTRLRRTAALIKRFPGLAKLDLRNNPLTLGFYPPITERRMVVHADHQSSFEEEEFKLDPFLLPEVDDSTGEGRDRAFESRLDPTTKLRRRLYEMLLLLDSGCVCLKKLDGLRQVSHEVLKKDEIWAQLEKVGVVKQDEGKPMGDDGKVLLATVQEIPTSQERCGKPTNDGGNRSEELAV